MPSSVGWLWHDVEFWIVLWILFSTIYPAINRSYSDYMKLAVHGGVNQATRRRTNELTLKWFWIWNELWPCRDWPVVVGRNLVVGVPRKKTQPNPRSLTTFSHAFFNTACVATTSRKAFSLYIYSSVFITIYCLHGRLSVRTNPMR